ncbi:MAG: hypothetical protein H6R47_1372 [Proteobacteria bacterium]|nr:hypothetical protein [Pseudomonadota bacterium]
MPGLAGGAFTPFLFIFCSSRGGCAPGSGMPPMRTGVAAPRVVAGAIAATCEASRM